MTTKNLEKNKTLITKTYDMEKPVEAVQMAVLLKNIVVEQKLFVEIKGKNYVTIDGWQLAGFLCGMNVIVDEPKNLSNDKEIKYSCLAKLFKGDKLVGVGYAICSGKEALKKSFDEYAILSMSQTRSISKAYRNKIGFIMKLAGFQATPSEEMHRVDEIVKEPIIEMGQTTGKAPVEYDMCSAKDCGRDITQTEANYSKKIFGRNLCRLHQKGAKRK